MSDAPANAASPGSPGTAATLTTHTSSPNALPDSPSTKVTEIPSLVRDLFLRARAARRNQIPQWRLNYRALYSRDWKPGSSSWDEALSVNQIFPVVASATAWLTDQRPAITVTPTADARSEYWEFYEALATDLNTALAVCFRNYNLDAEIHRVWWDVHSYGIGYLKTTWEAPLGDGLGDTACRRVDPFTIYPDPQARGMNDLNYIVEARQMTIADAERSWPGAARLLHDRGTLLDAPEAPHRLDNDTDPLRPRIALGAAHGTGYMGETLPSNSPGNNARDGGANSRFYDSPVITVLEAYVRETVADPPDENGTSKVTEQWRCIVVSGDVVLQDRPCRDIFAFPTHPYDRIVLTDVGEWYGPCLVEMLIPIQRTINWVLGSIVRNIHLAGNPQIVEDPRAAATHARISNRPGQRIPAHPNAIQWMNPPQMQPQISTDLVSFLKGEIETISGLSAMVRGFAPGGRNAQGVLDAIQDAAFVRVRESLREMERALRGVCEKMAAFVAEFYTEPRLMSIIGPDGRVAHKALNARHFYAVDAENPDSRIPLRFSLVADAGSSMPTSKQARAGEAKHLYELGIIDEFEVLRATEWPGAANIAERMAKRREQEAFQEGMASGPA